MLTDQDEYKLIKKFIVILDSIKDPKHRQLLHEIGCMFDILSSIAADVVTPHMEDHQIKRAELGFLMAMLAYQMREEYGVEGVHKIAKEFTERFYDTLKTQMGQPKLTLVN